MNLPLVWVSGSIEFILYPRKDISDLDRLGLDISDLDMLGLDISDLDILGLDI